MTKSRKGKMSLSEIASLMIVSPHTAHPMGKTALYYVNLSHKEVLMQQFVPQYMKGHC